MDCTNTSVFIATPAHNAQVCTRYVLGLLKTIKMLEERGIDHKVFFRAGDSLLDRARSECAHEFLVSGFSHMLFIDSDMGFCPTNLERLLAKNEDLVASVAPQKKYHWETSVRPASGHSLESQLLVHNHRQIEGTFQDGFVEATHVGTAFMLIRRGVFERMMQAYPQLRYMDEGGERWAFFQYGLDQETGRWRGEDLAFCQRWRALGGKIYVDLAHPLIHAGYCEYGQELQTHFCELLKCEKR